MIHGVGQITKISMRGYRAVAGIALLNPFGEREPGLLVMVTSFAGAVES